MSTKKCVVVIGGGTGTYTILKGLREYEDQLHISAIVTMADSGGSTGRLRDEFGYLPVGDVRMALAGLSPDASDHADILRDLFLYRFDKGTGLSGHNFGNLFLTALTDMLGSEVAAIETAGQILRVAGEVIPVTTHDVHLVATYASGRRVYHEHDIDEVPVEFHHDRIVDLTLSGKAVLSDKAAKAIAEADMIILGPGDLYTSILANCVVSGMSEALCQATGQIVYVANLMARGGQTIGMHVQDYVEEIKKYSGIKPHVVIVPDADLPVELVRRYHAEQAVHPVLCDLISPDILICRRPIVSEIITRRTAGDVLTRSFIRHDSEALARTIVELLHN